MRPLSVALRGALASDGAVGTSVRAFLRRAAVSSWQDEWANNQDNKFRMVKPSVQEWHSSFGADRQEEVVLTHLRIGHTHNAICCVVSRHLSVVTVVPHLMRHTSWWTAHFTYVYVHDALSDMLRDDRRSVSTALDFLNVIRFATTI
jgi:hypothetical protein